MKSLLFGLLISLVLLASCGTLALTPSSTPEPSPSTAIPTLMVTPTPTPTATPMPTSTPTPNPYRVYEGQQPPYKSGLFSGQIELTNNASAEDPTWQEVIDFILSDSTDELAYNATFRCGNFAQELHNNAEVNGIRAAWVAVDFENNPDSHALNAFNTLDKGLVFIDCTGNSLDEIIGGASREADKVAYVVIGKEYGVISIEFATSPVYAFYEVYRQKQVEYETKLEAYNAEVDAFNDALGGRTVLPEPEYSQFMEWADRIDETGAELDALENEIGDSFWEPLGIVISIEVYW